MTQSEVVVDVLNKLGGYATLSQLYHHVLRDDRFEFKTKTPHETIRRIVQKTPGVIFPIRRGIWGLESKKHLIPAELLIGKETSVKKLSYDHSYYQGLFVEIGKHLGYKTAIPAQDVNKPFLQGTLGDIADSKKPYEFSYKNFVQRASTVDVIWFNERRMPTAFIEVENSTDFQNSFGKFSDLQDFYCQFFIASMPVREQQFKKKVDITAYDGIRSRIKFFSYERAADWHQKVSIAKELRDFGLR